MKPSRMMWVFFVYGGVLGGGRLPAAPPEPIQPGQKVFTLSPVPLQVQTETQAVVGPADGDPGGGRACRGTGGRACAERMGLGYCARVGPQQLGSASAGRPVAIGPNADDPFRSPVAGRVGNSGRSPPTPKGHF